MVERRLCLIARVGWTCGTETEPTFEEARLEELPVDRLVNDPVDALADLWHSPTASPGDQLQGPGA
jgi:hypothetical protein